MSSLSLVCAVLDIAMEFTVNPLPLSGFFTDAGMMISFFYLLLRWNRGRFSVSLM